MDEGGHIKEPAERKDLWSRALSRPDRHIDRDPQRDTRAPDRQQRKTRTGGRT